MKKQLFIPILLASGLLCAQNIIRDPDFDKGELAEFHFNANQGTLKKQIITEDRTWNKCLRVEIVKDWVNPKTQKKETYISCLAGKEGKGPGFKAEPNTVYEFQFVFKCNHIPIIRCMEWSGTDFWKGRKIREVTFTTKPVVSNEWNLVKGSFVTSATAKRAAIQFFYWGKEVYKNCPPVGSCYMIDKLKIQKRKSLLPAGPAATVAEKPFSLPCILPGKTYGSFARANGTMAKVQTEYSCVMKDGKFMVDIRCMEPDMAKLAAKVTKDGGKVWSDDCVEIFFNSPDQTRSFNQFVVTAGGGRWMGRGGGELVRDFGSWTAKVAKQQDSWTVHAEFPLASLGWKKVPAPDETVRLFIARQRIAEKESSSSSPSKGSFQNCKNWGFFFPYGLDTWFQSVKKNLLQKASGNAGLTAEITKWTSSGIPEKDFSKFEFFKESLTAAKLSGRKFVLTVNPITADTEIPFIPASLENPPEKIVCRAAGNDFAWVPLAITNLTDRMEEYRVAVSAIEPKTKQEKYQLETTDGKIYPVNKMSMFRAVRVKDGDEPNHGYRYDPLAPMDVTQTVTVAPKESAPVWIHFDTANVTPGVYKGVVRVIPLGEIGSAQKKVFSYRDIPFSFEVLPFALPEKFVVFHEVSQKAHSKECFRQMLESQVNAYFITPWGASFVFDEEGTLVRKETSGLEKNIRQHQEWAKEYHVEDQIIYIFAYAAYRHFMLHHAKKLKPFSPAWEKAWLTYMKEIDAVREKCHIPYDRWIIELNDEPQTQILPEMTRAAELALKANPKLRFSMSHGASAHPVDELLKLSPCIYCWSFWNHSFFTLPEYAPLMADIRKRKALILTYLCSTSMRNSLQRYYRTLPWFVPCFDLHGCNLYQHTSSRYKTRDWKESAQGEVALMSGSAVVTTIRGECLNAGMGDLRYLAKLKEVQKNVKAGSSLAKEIQEFLDKTPRILVRKPTEDPLCFEIVREKMIDLILKAEKNH